VLANRSKVVAGGVSRRRTRDCEHLDISKRRNPGIGITVDSKLTKQLRGIAPSIFFQKERKLLPFGGAVQMFRYQADSVVSLYRDICAAAARLRALDADLGADFVKAGREDERLMPTRDVLIQVVDCEHASIAGRFGP